MRQQTEARHADRIAAAVADIEARLDNPPTTGELAALAGVSPYHFHRVFRVLTGESVQETIRRLRIARAVTLLRDESASVTDIALAVGYESSQAFAKAFKVFSGMSASDARAQPKALDALAERLAGSKRIMPSPIEIQVTSVEPFSVAALTRAGSPDMLAHGYEALVGRAAALGVIERLRGVYGAPLVDPFDAGLSEQLFECCIDVGDDCDALAGDEIRTLTLGGARYAVARHVGPYESLEATYAGVYRAVLDDEGWEFADSPIFNRYVDTPEDAPPEKRRVDVHVPVAPR